jgi:hypothetical protein
MSEHSAEPLTPSEPGTCTDATQDALSAIELYGRDHPHEFAGTFLSGHTIYVGFTHDAERHVADIRQRLSNHVEILPFSAEQTYATLVAQRDRIAADSTDLAREGVGLASVGIDTRANRVAIVVEKLTPFVEAQLADRYGLNITVRGDGTFRAL